MKAWSQFFPDVLPEVPGCPDPMLERALLRSAQDFCAGAHVWRVWLDTITTIASVTEYDIELAAHSELVKLERAAMDGRPLPVITPEMLPDDWHTSASARNGVFTHDRKTLTLTTSPAAGLALRVEATLKPSNNATGVEDFLFDQYVDQIAMGALARLMQKSAMPWSNPAKGLELERQFEQAIAGINFQRWRAFSSALPRAAARTF